LGVKEEKGENSSSKHDEKRDTLPSQKKRKDFKRSGRYGGPWIGKQEYVVGALVNGKKSRQRRSRGGEVQGLS